MRSTFSTHEMVSAELHARLRGVSRVGSFASPRLEGLRLKVDT